MIVPDGKFFKCKNLKNFFKQFDLNYLRVVGPAPSEALVLCLLKSDRELLCFSPSSTPPCNNTKKVSAKYISETKERRNSVPVKQLQPSEMKV